VRRCNPIILTDRSKSQSYFTTGGLPPISLFWRQDPWDSGPVFFFNWMALCSHSPYATSSLTRGWICSLQLLLAFSSAVILRSDSRGTRYHILLCQIRYSPTWRARSPYFYPPGTGWHSYTPRHWIPFSSLLRLRGLQWRYSTPSPHRSDSWSKLADPRYIGSARTTQKTRPPVLLCDVIKHSQAARTQRKHCCCIVWCHRLRWSVFTEPLPRNGLHNTVVLLLHACIT
jgi:hypothetical protein